MPPPGTYGTERFRFGRTVSQYRHFNHSILVTALRVILIWTAIYQINGIIRYFTFSLYSR